jgi:membrane-associated phospholipid phosphatase
MVMGAHYLSDVMFGALLSAIGYLIGNVIVDKFIVNPKKKNNQFLLNIQYNR